MSDTTLAVKTIKNSILNIASFVIGLVVNFYLLRYIVAQIGVGSYGISALLLAIVAPLNLTNLGFGEATTKYVAEFIHTNRRAEAAAYIRTTFFMNLMVGIAGLFLFFFFGGQLVMWAFKDRIPTDQIEIVFTCMKIISFGWLFNQCSATFMGIPVALQQFRKVAIGNLVFVIATALFTFAFLYNQLGLVGYTLATVGGQFAVLIYWYFTAKKALPEVSLSPKIDKEAWRNSFHYGGWQTLAQVGGILAEQATTYIMGTMLSIVSVGIYNVVLNIEKKVYALVHKLSEVLFPMFSAISNDSADRKANILIKSTWITTTVAVSLLVSVIPFAHPLIQMWMKNVDIANQGEFVLQIICLGGAFGSATTAGYFFLLGIGKTQKITYISILTGLVTVVSALIILPIYGLEGAGWSSLIAAMVQSLAIVRVMNTALKNVVPFTAILTAVFTPIITGVLMAFVVNSFLTYEFTNWFVLGLGYAIMFGLTAVSILLVTRLMPHGKEHEDLLKKLFSHLTIKLKARYN